MNEKKAEELEERIIALEMMAAFQEKTIGDLDQVIQEQFTYIERLEAKIDMMGAKIAETALLGDHSLQEEKPPHY